MYTYRSIHGIIMKVIPKQTAIHISVIIIQVNAEKLLDLYIDMVVMVSYNSRA